MDAIPDYSSSVEEKLSCLVAEGKITRDPNQFEIAHKLDVVIEALRTRHKASKSSALGWLFAKRRRTGDPIHGLYIHGSVGRGKTMLMDMTFSLAPIERKRRAHFHEFMADVHQRIHEHRQKLKRGETKQADPVPPVAEALFKEAVLLCFDEFTVTDIADAMILSRLFTELFARGCVLIATSNVEPDNLYRDGLNRQLFLPFITLLKANADIVSLDTDTDYRMEKTKSLPVWLTPLNDANQRRMDEAWRAISSKNTVHPDRIERQGRFIEVPMAAGNAARFSFRDLCATPLGAADFLAIAERYSTLFVENIPVMTPEMRNETKRFIILVDALYDAGIRLVASSEAMPEDLLPVRRGTEGFEFDRTVSRLFEMRSEDYLSATGNRSVSS
ncbi:cell division protein ZapE [Rhizobium alvei]|uniref:Cell division protein ZapE n=1 Tax=Rhizobium alvei TaxID=1132659 RepID=A0ABT8YN30_9HYPH|nr:cell division protein ZapE [Rhizobium alvei]MDO6964911.1 cell division protein ZapE [Rhizobium alvei]